MRASKLICREFWAKHPIRIVNLCFLVVFFCSILLTWREMVVLEDAYVTSQRGDLDNIATALDRRLQYSVDKLIFYRNAMQYALGSPITTDISRQLLKMFNASRHQNFWQMHLGTNRSMPISGVSDAFVEQSPQLLRNDDLLYNELSAAVEFGYIMNLSTNSNDLQQRTYYTSRAGFFISSEPVKPSSEIISSFYQQVTRPWFVEQSQRLNRARGIHWSSTYDPTQRGQIITASLPVDYEHYWFGVLATDFPLVVLNGYLSSLSNGGNQIYLLDSHLQMICASGRIRNIDSLFDKVQLARLSKGMERDNEGGVRMDSRYVSWVKLNNFDGLLIKIYSIEEGFQGRFSSITVAFILFLALFNAMLLFSWRVIRRMVDNMKRLQNTLEWQAWHDPLTRLYNRGAFFDRSLKLAERAKANKEPYSVVQIDLDHFKSINDRFGHHTGDRVLSHAASLISSSLRANDVAGRIGGEEFCVILPDTSLDDAKNIALRIRERINEREILIRQNLSIRISASFGVSSTRDAQDYNFEYLRNNADARLYKAKQNDRNQVCASD